MDITVATSRLWAAGYIGKKLDKQATSKQLVDFVNRVANCNRTLKSFFVKPKEHLSLKAKQLILDTLHDMLFEQKSSFSFQGGSAKISKLIFRNRVKVTNEIRKITDLSFNYEKEYIKKLVGMNGSRDVQTDYLSDAQKTGLPIHIMKLMKINIWDDTLRELYQYCCEQKFDTRETLSYLCENWTDSDYYKEISDFPDENIRVLTDGTNETLAKAWESIRFSKECHLNMIDTREQILQKLPEYDVTFNYCDPLTVNLQSSSYTEYVEDNKEYCFFDITKKIQKNNANGFSEQEVNACNNGAMPVAASTATTSSPEINTPTPECLPGKDTLLTYLGPASFYSTQDYGIKGNIEVMLNGSQFNGSDMLAMLVMIERRSALDHNKVLTHLLNKEHTPQVAKLLREIVDVLFSEDASQRYKDDVFMVLCELAQMKGDETLDWSTRYVANEITRLTGIPFDPDRAQRQKNSFLDARKKFFLAISVQLDKRKGLIPEEELAPSSSAQWKGSAGVQNQHSGSTAAATGREATREYISLTRKEKMLKYEVEQFEAELDRLWEMHPQLAFEYRHSLNSALEEAKRRLKNVNAEIGSFTKQVDLKGLVNYLYLETMKLDKEIDAIEQQKYASSVEKSGLAKMYNQRLSDAQAGKLALLNVISKEIDVLRELAGSE
ncbi:hypothetical protein SC171_21845 [Pantoea cypripedii]|uniref:hypothetical protein n=1 Tax=Pantoea cypripedii TaxID=55209 RepID=UPI002FC77077